jgi:hypothetical protein
MQRGNAQLLAPGRNILSSQHSGVRARLVSIGFHFHAAGHAADGFAAAGITQVSLRTIVPQPKRWDTVCDFVLDVREIGDVHEGIVERGEDACDAEDEFAYTTIEHVSLMIWVWECVLD